jgi:hypothetical protein
MDLVDIWQIFGIKHGLEITYIYNQDILERAKGRQNAVLTISQKKLTLSNCKQLFPAMSILHLTKTFFVCLPLKNYFCLIFKT